MILGERKKVPVNMTSKRRRRFNDKLHAAGVSILCFSLSLFVAASICLNLHHLFLPHG